MSNKKVKHHVHKQPHNTKHHAQHNKPTTFESFPMLLSAGGNLKSTEMTFLVTLLLFSALIPTASAYCSVSKSSLPEECTATASPFTSSDPKLENIPHCSYEIKCKETNGSRITRVYGTDSIPLRLTFFKDCDDHIVFNSMDKTSYVSDSRNTPA